MDTGFYLIFLMLISRSTSQEVSRSPCFREGYVVDEDDPRIYYLCTLPEGSLIYQIKTFFCNDGVFNMHLGRCSNSTGPMNYTCLKQNLDNDASKICYEETIQALEDELDIFIDAAAYRGNPARNFHLSVRDIHLNMRQNYLTMIQNTGRNIYPLIVATDNDTPELAGVGGAYKVYFRNGTMKRIVPVSKDFELHKCLSHMVLGVFSIISPYFRTQQSTNWQSALANYNGLVSSALFALPSSGLPKKEYDHAKKMLNLVDRFITRSLKDNIVSPARFKSFANELAPLIDKSMQIAAKAHVSATIPALQQLKAEMGPKEWSKLYVIIPTVWPVSLWNIRLQMFRKVMDFKQIKQQVLITEGARSEDDSKTTLGRIVADRALAQLVFGGLDDEAARDHLFSLSTRRDLLSSVEEEAIDKWCGGKDDWQILKTKTEEKSRCPMNKHFATILRHT